MPLPSEQSLVCTVKPTLNGSVVETLSLPSNLTAGDPSIITVELAASEADREIDLSAQCDSLKLFYVNCKSGSVVKFGTGTSAPADANKFTVNGNGYAIIAPDPTAGSPKIFLTNTDAVNKAVVEIGAIGSFSS